MNAVLVKAPPREPDVSTVPPASDYRAIVDRARRRQLELAAENLGRLAGVYDGAMEAVLERIRAVPDAGSLPRHEWFAAQANLFNEIAAELDRLRTDFAETLQMSMLASAQQVADREREVETLLGVTPDPRLVPVMEQAGAGVTVQFGSLAKESVERTAARYYADGLKLSDRLYSLDVQGRKLIEDTIMRGLAAGTSARDVAKEIEGVLAGTGVKNPRERAMTISRSEINTAFRESAVSATKQANGTLKPYISAVGWRLSLSHRDADVCDLYAGAEQDGLGPGNYQPDNVPVSHPNCKCNVLSVLTAYPDEQFVRLVPKPGNVPQSQINRAAQQGDSVAQWWVGQGGVA